MKKQRVELQLMAIKILTQLHLHLYHNIMTQIITTNNNKLLINKVTTNKAIINKVIINKVTINKSIIKKVTTNKEDMLKNTKNNKTTGMVEIDIIKIIGIITIKTLTIATTIKIIILINM